MEMNKPETNELNPETLEEISGGKVSNQGHMAVLIRKMKLSGYSLSQVVSIIRRDAIGQGFLVNPTEHDYDKLKTFVTNYYNSIP